jgi:hypothetical protein
LNLYVIRQQKDAAGDFFRAVQKQRPAQYQGLYLVAPDGKVLASHQNFKSAKTWPRELLADLQPGLKAFGAVKPREVRRSDPLPRRGSGIESDGAVTLAIYLRYSIKGVPLREVPNPTIDSLRLTAKELAQLTPAKPTAGTRWDIPEALARQFSRVLGPGDEDSMPRPNEVAGMKLTGQVHAVEDGIAHLVYEGTLSGAHRTQAKKLTHGEVKLTGVGRYDTKAGRMLSLLWVFDGVYKGPPPYDQPQAYSAVVEWVRERPKK